MLAKWCMNRGVGPHDVKVDVRLSIMKSLHARWIIEMYNDLKASKRIIIAGFKKAHVLDAVAEATSVANMCENPFQDMDIVVETS